MVRWFWACVRAFEPEKQVKLLQFATGTSRIPAAGFEGLQGRDGHLQPSTLTSVTLEQSVFPRAHTCFNRVDLPIYRSQRDLERRMEEVLAMDVTGFSMQ